MPLCYVDEITYLCPNPGQYGEYPQYTNGFDVINNFTLSHSSQKLKKQSKLTSFTNLVWQEAFEKHIGCTSGDTQYEQSEPRIKQNKHPQ